jgi:hypothetical protein
VVESTAEHAAISAEEPLIPFIQAAWEIVVRLLHQKCDCGGPALRLDERGRTEADR